MPGVTPTQPISTTYTYYTAATGDGFAHFFKEAKDPRGNRAAKTEYYTTTTGADSGRLKSVTGALGEVYTYTYAFNAADGTNTTFVTNPDGGLSASKADSYGKVVSTSTDIRNSTSEAARWRIGQSGYDAFRNQITQTLPIARADGSGPRTITYTYDIRGNREKVYSPHAAAIPTPTVTTYGPYGGPLTITDPTGRAVAVGYDENFMPTEVNDGRGYVGGYTFDARGSILARKDGNGKETSFDYDQFGNKKKETDSLGNSTNYEYDTLGRVITATDALGVRSVNRYDALGRVTQTTVAYGTPVSATTSYEYDANSNQKAVIDPLGRRTEYTYDAANRVIETKYADNTTVRQRYDWRGGVISTTDQLGRTTLSRYDLAGQLISTTVAAGTSDAATTVHEYDDAGRKVREYNPYGGGGSLPANQKYTRSQYDDADRLITATNQLGHSTVFTYDGANRKIAQTEGLISFGSDSPQPLTTRYGYDIRGRLEVVTMANGTTSRYEYDNAGNQKVKTDEGGLATKYDYDLLNRLLSVENPAGEKVSYTYDPLGRLKTIRDARLNTITHEYDALGRLKKKVRQDNLYEEFGYDLVGNRVSQRLADNNVNRWSYDSLNRVNGVRLFDATITTTIGYTSNGLRQSVTDERGVTSYSYDGRDRLTLLVQPFKDTPSSSTYTQSVGYAYDPAGNPTSVTTRNGSGTVVSSVSYGYDDAFRLGSVTESGVTTATTYSYNALGLRTQTLLPNGRAVRYSYDSTLPSRMVSVKHQLASESVLATPLLSYEYSFDGTVAAGKAGLRTGLTEKKNGTTTASYAWVYDNAYRLSSEARTVGSTTTTTGYEYDAAGNRIRQTLNGATTVTSAYDELDRLLTLKDATGAITEQYGYDLRGNQVQVKNGAGTVTRTYQWDGADRLVGATVNGGTNSLAMKYDTDGRRVQLSASGVITNYLWDVTTRYGDVLLETASSGAFKTSYILGSDEFISQKRGANPREYYLLDGQGSVRGLSDGTSGTLTDEYAYDTFGKLTSGDATKSAYLYTGQQYDAATELYSLRARYYSPKLGRFLSVDKWRVDYNNPVELNRYGYTANNPVNYSDPTGNEALVAQSKINWSVLLKVIPIASALACVTTLNISFLVSFFGVSLPQGVCTTSVRHSGRIQIQGADLRKSGIEGLVDDTISFPWSQDAPPTVAEGLLWLNILWNRLNASQQADRDEAYAAAEKFIRSSPGVGIWARTTRSYQNKNLPKSKKSYRIDIEILSGRAFI
jgi:RHS repeat-associated protein